jgi:hypothetical protein
MILLMDASMSAPSLLHYLSIISDFRQSWKVQHQLSDILFLVVYVVICGAEGWDEIEDFGQSRHFGQSDGTDQCGPASNRVC